MTPTNQLRFAVNDIIDNDDVSPARVPLSLLGEFQKEVADFLKGSSRDVNPADVLISIENGSLALVATGGLLTAITLWADLDHLKSTDSLNLIDLKRAAVVERWQASAQKNPHRRYTVFDQLGQVSFSIDSSSNFHRAEDVWVHVEKYLHGTVVDMGGSTKPNVHLKLDNGITLPPIASTQKLLAQSEQNRLYRPALLHVTAEENLITRELRNLNLLAFEDYQPSYNDDEFNQMVERGTKAWSNIPDATAWLENLRGNHA